LPLLTTFANQAAIAIENARLYEAAQQELAERVRAEEALRSSEEYTRNLIESSLDTIISVDMERHIVAFNKAAQETFGYRAEEILGKHIDVLYADPQDGLQVHQTTIEAGRCVREAPGLRKDGQVFPSLISASALHDARGEMVGVMGVSRDITESKRAEEALRESEELYRSLFDGVPVGIYRSTPSGEFLDVNLALVQLLGYPDRETLLAASAAGVYLKAADRRRWQALVEREGVVRDFETQIRRHDGTPIWVRDTGRIVRDADGSVLCYEGSLEDITARNLATQALRRYSDRLQTLHQIDQAILAAQSPDMIIQPVLRYFGQLIPCWAVGVVMFDFEADEMTAFISDTIAFESERQVGIRLPLAMFRDIEEGIAELGRGEVYVVKDLVSIFPPSQMLQILKAQEEHPVIAVPLRFQEELIGLIGFGVNSPDALTPEHIAIAREVAASLAVAFQQARLLEETQARWREAETLRRAGATLTETLSLDETLDRILEQLDQVVPYDSASVQLLREGQMEIVGGRGFAEPERVIGLKFPVPDDNPNTTVVVERRPVLLADAQATHPPFRESPHSHIHSWLGVPLFFRGRVIGILAVDSVERAHFDDRHVRLIAPFATQAAIAIENARLYEEARQHAEELSLLYQAARDTSASLEPAEVMRRLAGSVRQAAATTSVDVLVLNETGTRVTVMAQCASPQASPAESESD
ncbi:MAG: PAS domain S-box protein, partial [Chloroflexi bacterium]|nr:PAS domain S-box protein [Chloroflexota bacterium]